MFSNLNQSDELVFQIQNYPNNPHQQQNGKSQQEDVVMDQQQANYSQGVSVPTSTIAAHINPTRNRNKSKGIIKDDESNNIIGSGSKLRKDAHREIERQRRQEMGKLYESLRSLLPLEYIKGKRSISDHMHQAVNYINHLQGRIEELNIKKNKLNKKMSETNIVTSPAGNITRSSGEYCLNYTNKVSVARCWCGVEIIISSTGLVEEEGFALSNVMEVLIQQAGLHVITCASTTINQRLQHIIQCEAKDPTLIDISALQQKLSKVI